MCDRCYVCNRTASEVKDALKDQVRWHLDKRRDIETGVSERTIDAYNDLVKFLDELKKQNEKIPADILAVKISTIQSEPEYFKAYIDLVENVEKSVRKIKNNKLLAEYDFKDAIETLGDYFSFIDSVQLKEPVEHKNKAFNQRIDSSVKKVDDLADDKILSSEPTHELNMSVYLCIVCRNLMERFGPRY